MFPIHADFSFSMDSSHGCGTPAHLQKLKQQNRFLSLFNTAAIGAKKYKAKNNQPVLSNPALQNYRDIFEQEFSASERLYDLTGSGLPLGIQTLAEQEFFKLLEQGTGLNEQSLNKNAEPVITATKTRLTEFIQIEINRLLELKNILTGETQEQSTAENNSQMLKLETLIDECDYLWAHFPDYAETGGLRPSLQELSIATPQAISFLKRIRTELDNILKIYETHCFL